VVRSWRPCPSHGPPEGERLRAGPGRGGSRHGRCPTRAGRVPSRLRRPTPLLPFRATADDRLGFQKRLLTSVLICPCSEERSSPECCTDTAFWLVRIRDSWNFVLPASTGISGVNSIIARSAPWCRVAIDTSRRRVFRSACGLWSYVLAAGVRGQAGAQR
jgi:hypothetical protein